MRNRGSTPEEGHREIASFSEFGQDHIEMGEVVKLSRQHSRQALFRKPSQRAHRRLWLRSAVLHESGFPGVPADVDCFAEPFGAAATGSVGAITDMN